MFKGPTIDVPKIEPNMNVSPPAEFNRNVFQNEGMSMHDEKVDQNTSQHSDSGHPNTQYVTLDDISVGESSNGTMVSMCGEATIIPVAGRSVSIGDYTTANVAESSRLSGEHGETLPNTASTRQSTESSESSNDQALLSSICENTDGNYVRPMDRQLQINNANGIDEIIPKVHTINMDETSELTQSDFVRYKDENLQINNVSGLVKTIPNVHTFNMGETSESNYVMHMDDNIKNSNARGVGKTIPNKHAINMSQTSKNNSSDYVMYIDGNLQNSNERGVDETITNVHAINMSETSENTISDYVMHIDENLQKSTSDIEIDETIPNVHGINMSETSENTLSDYVMHLGGNLQNNSVSGIVETIPNLQPSKMDEIIENTINGYVMPMGENLQNNNARDMDETVPNVHTINMSETSENSISDYVKHMDGKLQNRSVSGMDATSKMKETSANTQGDYVRHGNFQSGNDRNVHPSKLGETVKTNHNDFVRHVDGHRENTQGNNIGNVNENTNTQCFSYLDRNNEDTQTKEYTLSFTSIGKKRNTSQDDYVSNMQENTQDNLVRNIPENSKDGYVRNNCEHSFMEKYKCLTIGPSEQYTVGSGSISEYAKAVQTRNKSEYLFPDLETSKSSNHEMSCDNNVRNPCLNRGGDNDNPVLKKDELNKANDELTLTVETCKIDRSEWVSVVNTRPSGPESEQNESNTQELLTIVRDRTPELEIEHINTKEESITHVNADMPTSPSESLESTSSGYISHRSISDSETDDDNNTKA